MENIKLSVKLLIEDQDTISIYMNENYISKDLRIRIKNYLNFIHVAENPVIRE
jgi:hypothetical protein